MALITGTGHTFATVASDGSVTHPSIAAVALDNTGVVSHAAANSTDQVHAATFGIDTAGATLLVVGVNATAGVSQVLSDNKGNTWNLIGVTGAGNVSMFAAGEVTSAADTFAVTDGTFFAGPMSASTNTVNPNSLLVSFQANGGADSAISAPFALVDALDPVPIFAAGIASAIAVAPIIGTYTATWQAPTSQFLTDEIVAAFTPAASTSTGGLSGQGSITVASPTRIRVHLTHIPLSLGTGMGNPIRFFEVGNIAWGNGGFFTRNWYLEHEHELIVAPIPDADEVLYSFGPGVTATITPE